MTAAGGQLPALFTRRDRPLLYILAEDGRTPVPCNDVIRWAIWLEATPKRIVGRTVIPGAATVSTVFLGLDHSHFGGPPILFESMIFWEEDRQYCALLKREVSDGREMFRYATWDEAEQHHADLVQEVAATLAVAQKASFSLLSSLTKNTNEAKRQKL